MKKNNNIGFEIWRLIYPILIYFAISFAVAIVYTIAIMIALVAEGTSDPSVITNVASQQLMDKALVSTIISSVLTLIVLLPIYFGDKKKEKKAGEYIKYAIAKTDKWVLVAILGFSAALSLNIIISYTNLANLSSGFEMVSEAIYNSSVLIQILATVIMAPVVEELLVRGLIYKRMTRWTSPIISAVVSSALFGLIHMNIVQFVYAFIIGMLLALVYEKFQNIWAPILFHFAANSTSILISNVPGVEELFESETILAVVCLITGVVMVALTVFFIKIEKVDGKKIEFEEMRTLGSQIEVQEKEKEWFQ
jgi:membrane protease YdiL (CAAX protease family)